MAQSPAETRRALKYTIRNLANNGEVSSTFFHDSIPHIWPWVQATIADRFDCSPDDVEEVQTEAGEYITAAGEPVAFIVGPFSVVDYSGLIAEIFPNEFLEAAE